jgi:DNA-binding GntR family transcriptional regulator
MSGHESNDSLGPLARGALRHQIVKGLLKGIILGELPTGTRLIASKLSGRFGVSATPIREALVELEQSGIVELVHHRGALVKSFERRDLRDYYAVRGLLESEAARLACGNVDPMILGTQRVDLERLVGKPDDSEKWVKDLLAVDHRVHLMLVEHCNNRRLVAEIMRYNSLGETLRDLMGEKRAKHLDAMMSLVELLDAMKNEHSGSSAMAAEAMGRHISIVGAMAESLLFDGKK